MVPTNLPASHVIRKPPVLLQQTFEEAESKKKDAEEDEGKPDQLTQLVTTFR